MATRTHAGDVLRTRLLSRGEREGVHPARLVRLSCQNVERVAHDRESLPLTRRGDHLLADRFVGLQVVRAVVVSLADDREPVRRVDADVALPARRRGVRTIDPGTGLVREGDDFAVVGGVHGVPDHGERGDVRSPDHRHLVERLPVAVQPVEDLGLVTGGGLTDVPVIARLDRTLPVAVTGSVQRRHQPRLRTVGGNPAAVQVPSGARCRRSLCRGSRLLGDRCLLTWLGRRRQGREPALGAGFDGPARHRSRSVRGQRVTPLAHLETVGEPVPVGIGRQRIGPRVGLVAVGQTVSVGVDPGGIGPDQALEHVRQAVVIGVTGRATDRGQRARRRPGGGPRAELTTLIDLVVRRLDTTRHGHRCRPVPGGPT